MPTLAEMRRERLSEPVHIDPVQQASWKVMYHEKKVRKHNTSTNRAELKIAKSELAQALRGSQG